MCPGYDPSLSDCLVCKCSGHSRGRHSDDPVVATAGPEGPGSCGRRGPGAGGDGLIWKKWIDSGTWEVDIAGVKYPAEVSLRPMYDPTNSAIRA